MATPRLVTRMICKTAAAPTTALEAPMAFNTPICGTFCRIWIWKKPPITMMPISKVKTPWVWMVLCWAE